MWDLWWTKWHWDRFFSEYFSFSLSISFHQCSIKWKSRKTSSSSSSSQVCTISLQGCGASVASATRPFNKKMCFVSFHITKFMGLFCRKINNGNIYLGMLKLINLYLSCMKVLLISSSINIMCLFTSTWRCQDIHVTLPQQWIEHDTKDNIWYSSLSRSQDLTLYDLYIDKEYQINISCNSCISHQVPEQLTGNFQRFSIKLCVSSIIKLISICEFLKIFASFGISL
jgi:hypothetical protein